MAQELILELFIGQTVGKQEMINLVEITHLERGGRPVRSKQSPMTRALTLLKQTGHAENPMQCFWTNGR